MEGNGHRTGCWERTRSIGLKSKLPPCYPSCLHPSLFQVAYSRPCNVSMLHLRWCLSVFGAVTGTVFSSGLPRLVRRVTRGRHSRRRAASMQRGAKGDNFGTSVHTSPYIGGAVCTARELRLRRCLLEYGCLLGFDGHCDCIHTLALKGITVPFLNGVSPQVLNPSLV